MSFNVINPNQLFRDSKGAPRASGQVTFFTNKTTTVASIFSDESLSVAQNNPYTLDAYGRIIGDVKFSGLMTLQVTNSDGSDIKSYDDISTLTPNETGTWTPVLSDAGTGGNVAGGTYSGSYSVSGNIVVVTGACLAIGTAGMTAPNFVYLQGLPFPAISTATAPIITDGITYTENPVLQIFGTTGSFKQNVSGSNDVDIIVSNLANLAAAIDFSIAYIR